MIKEISKKVLCCKCKHIQEILINENEDFESEKSNEFITFENYNLFKSPKLNCCTNCGYINTDLSKNSPSNVFCEIEEFKKNKFDPEFLLTCYARDFLNDLMSIRVWAKIFNILKFERNKFLAKNYRKSNDAKFDFSDEDCAKIANHIILILKAYTLSHKKNNYVSCFNIEVLAFLGESEKAKQEMLKQKFDENLREYLLECIELGETA